MANLNYFFVSLYAAALQNVMLSGCTICHFPPQVIGGLAHPSSPYWLKWTRCSALNFAIFCYAKQRCNECHSNLLIQITWSFHKQFKVSLKTFSHHLVCNTDTDYFKVCVKQKMEKQD